MIELVKLFFIFFKIGLFTIGGGLVSLSLLQNEAVNNNWITQEQFADMVAISQSTPGPIGINIATYIGFEQYGIVGSLIATFGIICPSIVIISIIAKFLNSFNDKKIVQWIYTGLRPAVIGLIGVAAYNIAKISLFSISDSIRFNYKAIVLFIILIIVTNKWKHKPIFYLLLSGIAGIILF